MKKGFWPFVVSTLCMLLGISSCKKNCINCFTYSYTGGGGAGITKIRICADQFSSPALYNAYLDTVKASGANVQTETLCDK